jgi:hypothetical protein
VLLSIIAIFIVWLAIAIYDIIMKTNKKTGWVKEKEEGIIILSLSLLAWLILTAAQRFLG